MEALNLVAVIFLQERQLRLGLDAFRDDFHVQLLA
jgi:hypothetical protein